MSGTGFTTDDRWGSLPVVRRISGACPRNRVVITGVVTLAERVSLGGAPGYRCEIDDGTGVIAVLFLGRSSIPALIAGACCTVEGTVQKDRKGLVVWNPIYQLQSPVVS